KFPFLGTISKPFTSFSLNNSIIPVAFLINYLVNIIHYQIVYEFMSFAEATLLSVALPIGVILSIMILQLYFWFTNKDLRDILAERVERRIKKLKVARIAAVKRHKDLKTKKLSVSGYIDYKFRWRNINLDNSDRYSIIVTRIFNQNHLNTVVAELFIFGLILFLGVFREYAVFQIPAAASAVLFLTIIIMFIGAITYWFRGWAISVTILFFFIINILVTQDFLSKEHYAYGLNYSTKPFAYTLENIRSLNS
ncbi:phospholipase, partial [Marivirga lumbricoides]